MPWLLVLPVGSYLYGRFIDADDGLPWRSFAVIGLIGFLIFYVIKRKL